MMTLNKGTWNTKTMAKISVLGVISFILMYFKFPLVWLAPPFLKMDISDLPSLLGAFALGPVAGVLIQLLKNVLNIVFEGTTTAGVGEFMNFFSGSVFAFIAGAVYFKEKNFKNAIIGMLAGIIAMTAIMGLANYYFIFPLYAKVFGWPIEKLVAMGTAVTDKVVDLKTMIVYTVIPFNLLKGLLTALVTIILYKRLSPILHK
ncbi:MAG: ECF transporter S component [Bacillota bacterium]|nr:ECF transporter S component [Bacillota bacterium]NLL61130.1 ECF transporter S component [Tissierellia bacterium]